MSMQGTSQILEQLMSLTSETEEVCSKHYCHLIKMPGSPYPPFCPECAKEITREKEEKVVKERTERSLAYRNNYLRHSIYATPKTKKCTFENYRVVDDETKRNKAAALKITRHIYKGNAINVLMYGVNGTGKTHLSMSILNKLREHNKDIKCLFISMDEALRHLKWGYESHSTNTLSEMDLRKRCAEADVLVIDDLGAELGRLKKDVQASDWSYKVLNGIVSTRSNKSTIYTSNLNMKEIAQAFDGRIASRMMANQVTLTFEQTTDKRVNGIQEGTE